MLNNLVWWVDKERPYQDTHILRTQFKLLGHGLYADGLQHAIGQHRIGIDGSISIEKVVD